VLHLASGVKVDLFVRGESAFDLTEFDRARPIAIHGEGDEVHYVRLKTAEDTILRKLLWYRLGGEQSDRQWGDVLGCLRGQESLIDRDYLDRWAKELQIEDLLSRALSEA
jgi:hypothetical protein